jgi:hypothetical protein
MIVINIEETDHSPGETPESCYYAPFVKYTHFTGRESTMRALDEMTFGHDQSQRVELLGLGGVGKPR